MIKIFRPNRLNNGGTPKFRALKMLRATLARRAFSTRAAGAVAPCKIAEASSKN